MGHGEANIKIEAVIEIKSTVYVNVCVSVLGIFRVVGPLALDLYQKISSVLILVYRDHEFRCCNSYLLRILTRGYVD